MFNRKRNAGYKWPDCAPPDTSDPLFEWNNNLTINGTQYRMEEIEPGRWRWVINKEAMSRRAEKQREKDDLWWALRTRPLTDEEMDAVRRHGHHLLVRDGVPYDPAEIRLEFNEALNRQAYLRLDAGRAPRGHSERI